MLNMRGLILGGLAFAASAFMTFATDDGRVQADFQMASGAVVLGMQRDYTKTQRPTSATKKEQAIARVAVQLAREDAGQYMTPQEIASKAVDLVGAAFRARAAIARGGNPDMHYSHARKVADMFGAELVGRGDLDGMVVGLRLNSGRFTSGADNLFYVS